jgi:hypothetical protein
MAAAYFKVLTDIDGLTTKRQVGKHNRLPVRNPNPVLPDYKLRALYLSLYQPVTSRACVQDRSSGTSEETRSPLVTYSITHDGKSRTASITHGTSVCMGSVCSDVGVAINKTGSLINVG